MPHALGTHHAALRLATDDRTYPDPVRSVPFAGKRILDLGSGAHPFPHVDMGWRFIEGGTRSHVRVDLYGAPEPELPQMRIGEHVTTDLNRPPWPFEGHRQFDVIVACELLEHLENPWQLLRRLALTCLSEDGIIIVSTPDITTVRSRQHFRKEGFFPWFAPPHIASEGHITPIFPHLLEEMAKRAGLKIADEAFNEPPRSWWDNASPAERQDILNVVRVYRLERA